MSALAEAKFFSLWRSGRVSWLWAAITPPGGELPMSILETGLTVDEVKKETIDSGSVLRKYSGYREPPISPSQHGGIGGISDLSLEFELDMEECDVDLSGVSQPPNTLVQKYGPTVLAHYLDEHCTELVDILMTFERLSLGNAHPEVMYCTILVEVGLAKIHRVPQPEVLSAIIGAQKQHKKNYNTETMEKWADGTIQTTFGVLIMLLCGIRWALRQKSSVVSQFIEERFQAPYRSIVSDSGLTKSLETIRKDYRNPAHHGGRVKFARSEVEQLMLLSTGCKRVSDWLKKQDIRPFGPDIGVLHNHLILSR